MAWYWQVVNRCCKKIRIAYHPSMEHASVRGRRCHLRESLRWSAARATSLVEILAAALGLAVPVAVGAAVGHLAPGLVAAVGGLLINDVVPGPTVGVHARRLAVVLAPALIATLASMLTSGALGDVLVVGLATAAALVGGYSRGLAVAAMRFVLALVLTSHAAESIAVNPVGMLALVALGALTAALISVGLAALPFGAWRATEVASAPGPAAAATPAQKYARWKRMLRQRAGWQYPLRLGGSLAVAAVLRAAWPAHHFHWIALVVAILTERENTPLPIKTTQRALGTLAGVIAAGVLVVYQPTAWGLVIAVAVLGGLRPLLKARSYVAYTAAITPLIVLLMSAARPLGIGVLLDRLVATLLGAALVIGANVLTAWWLGDARRGTPAG